MLMHNQQLSNGGYPADGGEVDEAHGWGTGLGQFPTGSVQNVGFALLLFPLTSSQPITLVPLPLRREGSARQTSHD